MVENTQSIPHTGVVDSEHPIWLKNRHKKCTEEKRLAFKLDINSQDECIELCIHEDFVGLRPIMLVVDDIYELGLQKCLKDEPEMLEAYELFGIFDISQVYVTYAEVLARLDNARKELVDTSDQHLYEYEVTLGETYIQRIIDIIRGHAYSLQEAIIINRVNRNKPITDSQRQKFNLLKRNK